MLTKLPFSASVVPQSRSHRLLNVRLRKRPLRNEESVCVCTVHERGIHAFIVSQYARCDWSIPMYGPLKFKAGFVAKMFRDLLPSVLNFYSK